jgi:tRNA(Arg) A34 adenosine deaminase TadA
VVSWHARAFFAAAVGFVPLACFTQVNAKKGGTSDAVASEVADPSDPTRGAPFEFPPQSKVGTNDAACGERHDRDAAGKPLAPAVLAQRDEIYQLMAYAVVFKDWQSADREPRRGHNIGGILVDPDWNVVWWERNSNNATCNGAHHGETRMMMSYLDLKGSTDLKCHQIFTSLEPCAMCSGMMTLQSVRRTVYGETDFGYGKAIERLHQDYNPHGMQRAPDEATAYPRTPTAAMSSSEFRKAIDADELVYQRALTKRGLSVSLTDYLLTDGTGDRPCASQVFDEAGELLAAGEPDVDARFGQHRIGCARRLFAGATHAFLDYPQYIASRKNPFSLTFHVDSAAPGGLAVDVDSGEPLAVTPRDRVRQVDLPSMLLPENEALYAKARAFFGEKVPSFYATLAEHVASEREHRPIQASPSVMCAPGGE